MKVFISGSRSISHLNCSLNNIEGHQILIGDCYGADLAIQRYLKAINHKNVLVFHIGQSPRYNIGNWTTNPIKGRKFSDKDEAMTSLSDMSIVFWNGLSNGSYNNIVRSLTANKLTVVYCGNKIHTFTSLQGFLTWSQMTFINI